MDAWDAWPVVLIWEFEDIGFCDIGADEAGIWILRNGLFSMFGTGSCLQYLFVSSHTGSTMHSHEHWDSLSFTP